MFIFSLFYFAQFYFRQDNQNKTKSVKYFTKYCNTFIVDMLVVFAGTNSIMSINFIFFKNSSLLISLLHNHYVATVSLPSNLELSNVHKANPIKALRSRTYLRKSLKLKRFQKHH